MTGTPTAAGLDPVILPLGRGMTAEFVYPAPDAVAVTMCFRGRRLWHHQITLDGGQRRFRVRLGVIRVDLMVISDLFAGIVEWRLRVYRRAGLGRPWATWRTWGEGRAGPFDPSVGIIGEQSAVYPPSVPDSVHGGSQTCTGVILRLHVDDEPRKLCQVGHKVKARMFPAPYPPFVFNAVACVGAFEEGGPQRYTNPHSVWFNVFLGYYQLDCSRSSWSRPFGFEEARGANSRPCIEDLVRLGKSDWNFFSNWDYGVPEQALERYCNVELRGDDFVDHGLVAIAGGSWRRVDLLGVEVASSYVSDQPGAGELVRNTLIAPILRRGFGFPNPQPDRPVSFIPQKLDATLHMAYYADETEYHTLIFGGTAHAGADRDLLDAEIEATKAVITERYAGFGFS